MFRQLKNNDRGIIFVTVLMIIIVMTVLTVSMISMNVSQTLLTESEVKRIQAEILAMGAIAYTFANQLSASPSNSLSMSQTIDNVTFNVTADISSTASGPLGTSPINVNVYY